MRVIHEYEHGRGFQTSLRPSALDESSLSIGMVIDASRRVRHHSERGGWIVTAS